MATTVRITHWFPIITFCPVNRLPDLIYVAVTFDQFKELYGVRRAIKRCARYKLRFMEDIADDIAEIWPDAVEVEVSLLFDRHKVTIKKD